MIVIISKGNLIKFVAAPLGVLALGFGLFNGVFFYNEAGFMTHVRTIFGDEKIVDDVGYATKWFGRATTWKKAISVQSVLVMDDNDTNPDNDGLGATIEAFPIVFLGNVDAKVESSARFRLPGGEPFLKMAQEYRNPDNFIRTALVPAIKETLQATASLMSADDYYAGARSEFAAEFENQLNDGLYLIKRKEVRGPRGAIPHQTAILQAGTEQGAFGDNNASQFVTEKVTDAKGIPVRKQQQFRKFGVEVVEARITNVDPNPQYKQRMVKVQQALAELAVARQNRLKEEEEKLLVTARGEKEVEAKRQETLRDQIERTTQAETDKQLAVINAEREKQRAEIEKQTAELLRDKATVTAQATKITADAEAYAREAVIKADGALQPKLDALIAINKVWAEAAAQAPVPSVMMGAGANGAASRQDEIGQLMGVLATKAARDLALDLKVKDGFRQQKKRPAGRFLVSGSGHQVHRVAAVEAEFVVRTADQLGLLGPHHLDRPLHVGLVAVLVGQLQVVLEMPRLGLQQTAVEFRQLRVQVRHQGGEALAGTRLDEGADHQRIGQPLRLLLAHQVAQRRGVAGGADIDHRDTAFLQDRQHLLEVAQLLARQAAHLVHQVQAAGVLADQLHRRRRGLHLAGLVVQQHDVLALQGRLDPGGGSGTGEELVDLGQHGAGHSFWKGSATTLVGAGKAEHYTEAAVVGQADPFDMHQEQRLDCV